MCELYCTDDRLFTGGTKLVGHIVIDSNFAAQNHRTGKMKYNAKIPFHGITVMSHVTIARESAALKY